MLEQMVSEGVKKKPERRSTRLISPRKLRETYPRSSSSESVVLGSRKIVENILEGIDKRLLIIIGPCSINDPEAALDYARKLKRLSDEIHENGDNVYLIMRTYFEKPRTTVGWKGLVSNPEGLVEARKLLRRITELEVPCATEFLNPYVFRYIQDHITWSAIGARNNKSQPHREFGSDLEMPVGIKNSDEGGIVGSRNSIIAAGTSQDYFGIDDEGYVAFIENTLGNLYAHLILRGSENGPNYDRESVAKALRILEGVRKKIVIDGSHDQTLDPETGEKDYMKQEDVAFDIVDQRVEGNEDIVAFMCESYLVGGSGNKYGQSKTDKCLGWEDSERLVRGINKKLNL